MKELSCVAAMFAVTVTFGSGTLRVGMTAAKMTSVALMLTPLMENVWAESLVIADRGKEPAYAIVVPSVASPSLKYAAEELRDLTPNGIKKKTRVCQTEKY